MDPTLLEHSFDVFLERVKLDFREVVYGTVKGF